MYVLLIFVFFIIAILTKNSKFKILNSISLFILVPFLMFNRENPDYTSYLAIFNNPYAYAENGYILLINIIKRVGGQSHNYIIIILGLFLLFTLLRWRKYVNTLNIVVFMYAIFPFVIDIIQIRNTFMILFVLNAIIELINGKKIKCMFYLFLSSQFHAFGYLFILAFGSIILIKKKKNFHRLIIIGNLLLLLVLPIIIKLMLPVFPKLSYYITATSKLQSLLVWGLILISDLLIFNYFILKKTINSSEENKKIFQLFYDIIYTGIIFYPGLLYINEFSRFFRSTFIIKYLFVTFALPHINKKSRVALVLYLFSTAILLSVLYSRNVDYSDILLQNLLFGNYNF